MLCRFNSNNNFHVIIRSASTIVFEYLLNKLYASSIFLIIYPIVWVEYPVVGLIIHTSYVVIICFKMKTIIIIIIIITLMLYVFYSYQFFKWRGQHVPYSYFICGLRFWRFPNFYSDISLSRTKLIYYSKYHNRYHSVNMFIILYLTNTFGTITCL